MGSRWEHFGLYFLLLITHNKGKQGKKGPYPAKGPSPHRGFSKQGGSVRLSP